MAAEELRRRIESKDVVGAFDSQESCIGGLLSIGYGALCAMTLLPKRSVQRVIARLIQKKFISI
jgi:hypothetical protein